MGPPSAAARPCRGRVGKMPVPGTLGGPVFRGEECSAVEGEAGWRGLALPIS